MDANMKRPAFYFLLTLFLIQSCKDTDVNSEMGRMSFAIREQSQTNKYLAKLENITKIFMNIETPSGETVYQLKEITLLKFGESFISEELSLPAANYRITEFFAANEKNEILYATPLVGSDLAPLVSHPLPIDFTVNANSTESIEIEVVDVADHQPIELGYVTFALTETTKSLLKIIANTEGITNINRVRVWASNKETHEHQWTNLHLSSQNANQWEGSIILPNGDYEVEIFVEAPTQKKNLAIAYVKKIIPRIERSATLTFDHLKDQIPRWVSASKHFTALVGIDPCDLTFSIYPNNEVSTIDYYYFDRIFWNADGDVITYTYDEVFCDSSVDCGNGSVYTSTLLPIAECETAKQQSNFIDAMMIIASTLKSGEPAEETYFFYDFKPAPATNHKLNFSKSPADRKIQLRQLINHSVKN